MKKLILFLCLCSAKMFCQLPSNDSTWVLKMYDPFDSLKTSLWISGYPWGPVTNGAEYDTISSLIYSGGSLKEKAVKLTTPRIYNGTPYYYLSGQIFSKFTYLYGYWEVYMKLPQGQGYWPAFWMWNSAPVPTGYPCPLITNWYNEIDILELSGSEIAAGNLINNHYHYRDTAYYPPPYNSCNVFGWDLPITVNASDTTWHKYALKWMPNRMTFYFDDQIVRDVTDATYTPRHAMYTILALGIDPDPLRKPNLSTVFPAYLTADYIKIWQQVPDCSTPVTVCGAFPSGYDHKVKKSIALEGSGCSGTINTSRQLALWATDFVLLDEGTAINPDGSGQFSIEITNCPL
jgi:hypothetical protein